MPDNDYVLSGSLSLTFRMPPKQNDDPKDDLKMIQPLTLNDPNGDASLLIYLSARCIGQMGFALVSVEPLIVMFLSDSITFSESLCHLVRLASASISDCLRRARVCGNKARSPALQVSSKTHSNARPSPVPAYTSSSPNATRLGACGPYPDPHSFQQGRGCSCSFSPCLFRRPTVHAHHQA